MTAGGSSLDEAEMLRSNENRKLGSTSVVARKPASNDSLYPRLKALTETSSEGAAKLRESPVAAKAIFVLS